MKFHKIDKRFRLAKADLAQFYFDADFLYYFDYIHPLLKDTYGVGLRLYPSQRIPSRWSDWYYQGLQEKIELFPGQSNISRQVNSINRIRVFLSREEQLTYLSLILK